jgi:hypothetical protein
VKAAGATQLLAAFSLTVALASAHFFVGALVSGFLAVLVPVALGVALDPVPVPVPLFVPVPVLLSVPLVSVPEPVLEEPVLEEPVPEPGEVGSVLPVPMVDGAVDPVDGVVDVPEPVELVEGVVVDGEDVSVVEGTEPEFVVELSGLFAGSLPPHATPARTNAAQRT